jgi:DNA-binding LytR/AlgR family response regulator
MECNKTKCLIIDDEPLAIKLIKTHLGKLDSFEIAGECKSALKAVEYLQREKIDLMFLDINMPEINGLDFLKSIPDPPYVVITTAYREYAIEGYDLDVVDFLLKPISFERFLKAINRFCNRSRKVEVKSADIHTSPKEMKFIYIQDGKNIFKILYDDVLYFEGYGEYVKVITAGKNYIVRDSLTEFEHKFSTDYFIRIHKSYIINTQKITGFNAIQVILKNTQLPIGRMYREKVMSVLKPSGGIK